MQSPLIISVRTKCLSINVYDIIAMWSSIIIFILTFAVLEDNIKKFQRILHLVVISLISLLEVQVLLLGASPQEYLPSRNLSFLTLQSHNSHKLLHLRD